MTEAVYLWYKGFGIRQPKTESQFRLLQAVSPWASYLILLSLSLLLCKMQIMTFLFFFPPLRVFVRIEILHGKHVVTGTFEFSK